MKKLSLAAAMGLTASMLVSGMALAAGTESASFETLDQNMDGQLTPDEVSSSPEVSERWTELDIDESGTIDRVEFSAFEEGVREPSTEGLQEPGTETPMEEGQ